jgi:hypothetical protein
MRLPTLSISLTTSRRSHLLARTIESVLAQSVGDFDKHVLYAVAYSGAARGGAMHKTQRQWATGLGEGH